MKQDKTVRKHDKTINFGARFAYLTAIETHWPEVMKSLLGDAFPLYEVAFKSAGAKIALETWARLLDALTRGASLEIKKAELAIRTWAEFHGFRDAWLHDFALHTMQNWALEGPTSHGKYLPEDLDIPALQLNLGHWMPHVAPWTEFSRITDKNYHTGKARYRAAIMTLWGEGQPKLSQSAIWTVLWQRGKSPGAIRIRHFKTTGKNVSLANIQSRVHGFANSAGLTLRLSTVGPRKIQPPL
jgi:hypothetical protein